MCLKMSFNLIQLLKILINFNSFYGFSLHLLIRRSIINKVIFVYL